MHQHRPDVFDDEHAGDSGDSQHVDADRIDDSRCDPDASHG
jgi:hypothetical protein